MTVPTPAAAPPLDVLAAPLHGVTLIEASAGSGKTWSLCALVLRHLLEARIELPRILVVTYTTAASAELSERIRERIVQVLAVARGDAGASGDAFVQGLLERLERLGQSRTEVRAEVVLRLQQALHDFDDAAIHTIHGYAQRMLAESPFAAALPLAQELIPDETELRLAAVQDFWREQVLREDLPLALAAELLARKDSPEAWSELVAQQIARPWAPVLLASNVGADSVVVDTTPTGTTPTGTAPLGALQAAFDRALALWRQDRRDIVGRVQAALDRLNRNRYSAAGLDEAVRQWDRWFDSGDALAAGAGGDKAGDRRHLLTSRSLVPNKGKAPPDPHPFFDAATELLDTSDALRRGAATQRIELLVRLLRQVPARLAALKAERRLLSYDDLLQQLDQRLHASDGGIFLARLRARHAVALIDEFQDTDPLQWRLFERVFAAGGAPLVLLGDPKQAIYGFRNADLQTYLLARRRADHGFTLATNQRSTPALIDALNALFGRHARPFVLPQLHYTAVVAGDKPRPRLVDRSAPRAALQLWSLPEAPLLDKREARQAATAACAAEIERLLDAAARGEITLDERALAASDIAVIVRNHGQGALMRSALAARGIGCVELSRRNVHVSHEARELEQVLAAMLEPRRAGLVRAALATDAMGWDAAAIAALDNPGNDRQAEQIERFARWSALWRERGIATALRSWYREAGVPAQLLRLSDGERRLSNLMHLFERLQQAAAEHRLPAALARWLQQQRLSPRGDEEHQLRLESDRDLVRIVTIHRSKGLEYGIVLCPYLWDGHPGPPRRGIGHERLDADGRVRLELGPDKPVGDDKAALARHRLAESVRLVYVALTRAVHRVMLVVGPYLSGRSSNEAGKGALAWLLEGPREAGAAAPAWADWARSQAPAVDLQPLPPVAGAMGLPLALPASPARPGAQAALVALTPPAHIAPAWQIASYSSLARSAAPDAWVADHDQALALAPDETDTAMAWPSPRDADAETPSTVESALLAPDDVLHFPRGAAAGVCLHALFEQADWLDPASWPALAWQTLRTHPPEGRPAAPATGATSDAGPAAQHPRLLRLLRDVAAAELLPLQLPGLRLAAVPASRCVSELEFMLPVPGLAADDLAALMRQHGLAAPVPEFPHLHGYLRGFIDLVFEHQGRFHVIDWKSNHLGARPVDYAAPALERAMQAHGYTLQALLYGLALHRWLRWRVPGYAIERHFGQVLMLFVRGVRPDWRNPDGSACGVHRVPLEPALIEALSNRLEQAT